jgi:hypothetical protein
MTQLSSTVHQNESVAFEVEVSCPEGFVALLRVMVQARVKTGRSVVMSEC